MKLEEIEDNELQIMMEEMKIVKEKTMREFKINYSKFYHLMVQLDKAGIG